MLSQFNFKYKEGKQRNGFDNKKIYVPKSLLNTVQNNILHLKLDHKYVQKRILQTLFLNL